MIRPEKIKPVFDCTDCDLHKGVRQPVWGRGPKRPLFMMVGEGPGPMEDKAGFPFHPKAPAGELIKDILSELGVERKEIYLTNATRCFKGNGKITTDHIKACKKYLLEEIKYVKPEWVVIAGNEALKSLLGHEGITKERGHVIVKDGQKYFPIIHPAAALPFRTPEYRKLIKEDLRHLIGRIKNKQESILDSLDCKIAHTRSGLLTLMEELEDLPEDTIICSDFETSNVLTPFHDIVPVVSGMSLAWGPNGGWYIPTDHRNPFVWDGNPKGYELAKKIIRKYAHMKFRKIGQNIKFEQHWMRGMFGTRIKYVWGDTMMLSHLLNPVRGIHGLDKLAWFVGMGGYEQELEEWFAQNVVKEDDRDYLSVPLELLGRYSIGDSVATWRYHNLKYPVLEKRKSVSLYHKHVINGIMPYADMEARGQAVDVSYLSKLETFYFDRISTVEHELNALIESVAGDFNFNYGSWEQVGKLLTRWLGIKPSGTREYTRYTAWSRFSFDRYSNNKDMNRFRDFAARISLFTTSGILSTDKKVIKGILNYYKPLRKPQREFLEGYTKLKKIKKRLSTNVRGLRKYICQDNRVRTNILLHGAGTSRRAMVHPPMQQIPKERVYRRVFVAAPGYLMGILDYRNQEVRIAANRSMDEKLCQAFLDGKDIHCYVASLFSEHSYKEIFEFTQVINWDAISNKPKMVQRYNAMTRYRELAKLVMWVILFGGGAGEIAQLADVSTMRAQSLMDRVFSEFAGFKKMRREDIKFAEKYGFAKDGYGRRRYIDGIHSTDEYVKAKAHRLALNTPIQMTGANITYEATRKVNKYMRKEGYLSDKALILVGMGVQRDPIKAKLLMTPVGEVHDSIVEEIYKNIAVDVILESKQIMESIKAPLIPNIVTYEVDGKIGHHLGTRTTIDSVKELSSKELFALLARDYNPEPSYYDDATQEEEDDEEEEEFEQAIA